VGQGKATAKKSKRHKKIRFFGGRNPPEKGNGQKKASGERQTLAATHYQLYSDLLRVTLGIKTERQKLPKIICKALAAL
jgi:hypothetical protein